MIGVSTAFINLLKLTLPLYIFQVLDRVIASRSVDTLILLTAMTAFAVLIATGAELIRRWMLMHWANWFEQRLGKELFLGGLERNSAQGPSRALEDLRECSQFASGSGAISWLDAAFAPAFVFLVYLIHPTLGYIVIGCMAIILVLGIANEVLTRPMRKAARRAKQRGERWVLTAEQNRETVAGLNVVDFLAERWHRSLARRGEESRATRMTATAIGEGMRLVENGQRIACYAVGVWLAVSDELTVGGIIAASVLGRLGTSAVRRAMVGWRQLSVVIRSYRRIKLRLRHMQVEEHAIRDPDAALELHLDHVTFAHSETSRPVLRNLELTVAPGQVLCVLGPSGAGKSTLARLIAGSSEPTKGTVRLGGLDIARFTRAERQHLLGYLQQETKLLTGTIAENISGFRRSSDAAIVEAARLAGIHDVVNQLPEGYETVVHHQHSFLAGGEIRRLGIARAIFGRPKLIILDEPEANLDEALVASLTGLLNVCKSWESIVVVTSQQERFAAVADQIVVLEKARKPRLYPSFAAFSVDGANERPDQPAIVA